MSIEEEIRKQYAIDLMAFISENPFFGSLLLDLDVEITYGDDDPLASINHEKIRFRAKQGVSTNYLGLSNVGRTTLLAHEVHHLALEHLTQCPEDFHQDIANIAMDAAVNRNLADSISALVNINELPSTVLHPVKSFGTYTGFTIGVDKKFYPISDYKDKDWIEIYYDLCKDLKIPPTIPEASAKDLESLDSKFSNDFKDVSPSDNLKGRDTFRLKVLAAYNNYKHIGTIPAEVVRLVNELTTSKVNWKHRLRSLVKRSIDKSDFAIRIDSKRQHLRDPRGRKVPPLYPKLYSERIDSVIIALDTSGSMKQKDLEDGLSEFKAIRKTTPFKIYFVTCDAKASKVQVFEANETPNWETLALQGGGGTSFVPVFELAKEIRKKEEICFLAYFTDTMGTFPKEGPKFPVFWISNYPNAQVPFGTLIQI